MRYNRQAAREIRAIQTEFPKCNKMVYSVCTRTEETGAQFCKRAEELRRGARVENREKTVRFSARLTEADAEAVCAEMTRRKLTKQDLIEGLLIEWSKISKKEE